MQPSLSILHEDTAIIVIDKPAGVPTLSAPDGIHPTIAEWLLARDPALASAGPKPEEAGLLHRLDNGTSGCLLAAKTPTVYKVLRTQFDAHTVRKEYIALLLGATPARMRCTTPIAHHPRKPQRMLACGGTKAEVARYQTQPAETQIERLQLLPIGPRRPSPYSLCRVTITTGVRHQIRVHCAAEGYPLAGDRLYQNARSHKEDTLPLKHHFLHASRLGFIHPTTQQRIAFEAPLPADLQEVLDSFR